MKKKDPLNLFNPGAYVCDLYFPKKNCDFDIVMIDCDLRSM